MWVIVVLVGLFLLAGAIASTLREEKGRRRRNRARPKKKEWTAAERNAWWERELAPYKDAPWSTQLAVRRAVLENRTAPWM